MNYRKIYDDLMISRKSFIRVKGKGVYFEKHHIIPRSLGGSKIKENEVLLTGREHFIAHKLLVKIYKDPGAERDKMVRAMWKMCNRSNKEIIVSAKDYEEAKTLMADVMSRKMKGKPKSEDHKKGMAERARKQMTGKPSHMKGKKASDATKEKQKQAKLGKPSWNKGIPHTEKHKENLKLNSAMRGKSPTNKGIPASAEQIEKNRLASLGKKQTPETIIKRTSTREINKFLKKINQMVLEGQLNQFKG